MRAAGWLASAAAALLVILAARRFGTAFLARRLAMLFATLIAASVVVFVIVQIVPGDPVRYMMGLQAQPETVAAMRHQLGLDAAPSRATSIGWAVFCRETSDEATPIAFRSRR